MYDSEKMAELLEQFQFSQETLDKAAFEVIKRGAKFQEHLDTFVELLM